MSKTNFATTQPPCTVHQCKNCLQMFSEPVFSTSQLAAIIEQVIGADENDDVWHRTRAEICRNELREEQRRRLKELVD